LNLVLFKEAASQYYNSPLISLYSTFEIFTIEGWFEIPEKGVAGLTVIPAFFTFLFL
jgi:voltage-gated sodium channel